MYKAGFGINPEEFAVVGPTPYAPDEKVVVSVGSMLFDPSVVQIAASKFPELQFHVIGPGIEFDAGPNIHIHAEMPFEQTLAFVKHASVGLAPYAPVEGSDYLAESSLKLMQFEYFGLPSVCPDFAVGSSPNRIGYVPGDGGSITRAISRALSMVGQIEPRSFPSWEEIALQVIEPKRHAATLLG
jgi:2-beta-glucuronyltransferase